MTIVDKQNTANSSASSASVSMRTAFQVWLNSGHSKKHSTERILSCMDSVSEYAVSKKISSVSLWDVVTADLFKSLYNKLVEYKLLRVTNNGAYKVFISAGQLYYKFLKEKPRSLDAVTEPEMAAITADILPNVENQSAIHINPEDVIAWLVTQPNANGRLYLESAARTYMSALRNVPKKLELDRSVNRDVFSCQTASELDSLWGIFKSASNFAEINRTLWHGQFSAGLAVYKRYLEHLESDDVGKEMPMSKVNLQAINNNDINIIVYDWMKKPNLNGTKPVSIKFIKTEEFRPVKSWKALLICFYDFAVSSFPNVDITSTVYGISGRKLCSYNFHEISYAAKLSNGLYIDAAWSANNVVGIIKTICDHCAHNVAHIEIFYKTGSIAPVYEEEIVSVVEGGLTDEEQRVLDSFKAEFPVSMSLGFVDLKKLKGKYGNLYGRGITLSDEQIDLLIRNNAVQIDINRYTHIDNLVSADALQRIKDFIDMELAKAIVHRVYIKPLFDKYKLELSFAVNEELLLTIIELAFGGEYKANRKSMFIARRNNTASPNIKTEIGNAIVKLLSEEIQPFDADGIAQQLPIYPKWRIESVLNSGLKELVAVSGGKYAHTDYVYIAQDDIEKIETIIASRIKNDSVITEDDLYVKIAEDMPDIIEMNPEISKPDILKVIRSKLSGTFKINYDWQSDTRFLPKEGV